MGSSNKVENPIAKFVHTMLAIAYSTSSASLVWLQPSIFPIGISQNTKYDN